MLLVKSVKFQVDESVVLLNRQTDLMQTTISDYTVGYAANLTFGSMTANLPGASTNFGGTNNYTHDEKLQLTQETSTQARSYTNNQAYNLAGNPTTFKGVNAASFGSLLTVGHRA